MQFDEHAGKELLVRHGVAFQTVGHNVVDIFDKHHVGIDVVEVFNKRAVAARAEEQAAVLLAERRIVGVGGRRVGRGFLFRETDVESGIVGGGILRGFLGCQCLEEGAVLGRHGEVHVHFSVLALSVERAFHEVFFQRRARALGVVVEFQQTFRQCAVVEAVLAEQRVHHGLVCAVGEQGWNILAVQAEAGSVEVGVESRFIDIIEKRLFKIALRRVVFCICKGEEILEHAAGRARGRHELHNLVRPVLIVVPCGEVVGRFGVRGLEDSFADSGCAFEFEEGEAFFKACHLLVELLFADAFLRQLCFVLCVNHGMRGIRGLFSWF